MFFCFHVFLLSGDLHLRLVGHNQPCPGFWMGSREERRLVQGKVDEVLKRLPRGSFILVVPYVDPANGRCDITVNYAEPDSVASKGYEDLLSVTRNNNLRMCAWCNKTAEKLLRCGGCGKAEYCDKSCQRAAWKGGHKQSCLKK